MPRPPFASGPFAVHYDTKDGIRSYCLALMDEANAQWALSRLRALYLNADGTPKAFPNGKGTYDVHNPRVVRVR